MVLGYIRVTSWVRLDMQLQYATQFAALTVTQPIGSSQTGHGADRVAVYGDNPLLESWRSADRTQQRLALSLTAINNPIVYLLGVNARQVEVGRTVGTLVARNTTVDDMVGRAHLRLPENLGSTSTLRVEIEPSAGVIRSDAYYEIGAIVVIDPAHVIDLPRGMLAGADISLTNTTLVAGHSSLDLVDNDIRRTLQFSNESDYDFDDPMRGFTQLSPAQDILLFDRLETGVFSPMLCRRQVEGASFRLDSAFSEASVTLMERV